MPYIAKKAARIRGASFASEFRHGSTCYTPRMDLRTWFASLPKFGRGAFSLFAIVAVLTLVLADQPIAQRLLLTPHAVLEGAVWQPLTAIFLYPDQSAGLLIGTLLIQWFVGSELEFFWGLRRYLLLVLGCAIAGHLASMFVAWLVPVAGHVTVGGATPADLAALTAFAVVFGRRPLRFFGALPLSGRGLAWLIIGLTIVPPLLRGAPWPVAIPWIVAVALAALVTTQPWRSLRNAGKMGLRRKRKSNHLRVVRPDPQAKGPRRGGTQLN